MACELADRHPLELVGIRRARRRAAGRTADEIDQHVVIVRAPLAIQSDAIEHGNNTADFDFEPCFFANFSRNGGLERFARFDGAAWNTPLALERLPSPSYEEHQIAVQDDRADTHDRPRRVFAIISHQVPRILTTTRFFRWPSNSA